MDSSDSQSISNWFNVVLRLLETHGYPKHLVLMELGLSTDLLTPAKFHPLSQLSNLWLYAYEKFGTMVGILVAEHFKPQHWSDVGLLLQSSKNLDEFLKRICQFVPLISTGIQLSYQVHTKDEMKFTIKFKEPVAVEIERIEACLLCGWKLANLLHEDGCNILRFEHVRTKPKDSAPWEQLFGENISWGAKEAVFYFYNEEVFRQTVPVNEKLSQTLEMDLSQKLNKLYANNYTYRVKQQILLLLGTSQPTLEQIAKILNISSRSLQRHLEEEGCNFRSLLNSIQIRIAKEYLNHTNYSLFEIALLTGFSSSSNFCNAFKRSTQISPGQYRETSTNSLDKQLINH